MTIAYDVLRCLWNLTARASYLEANLTSHNKRAEPFDFLSFSPWNAVPLEAVWSSGCYQVFLVFEVWAAVCGFNLNISLYLFEL
jgi:hypothetical protein